MLTLEDTNIFTFTSEQFFILAGMFRLDEIVGYQDPYRGWLVEEIKERSFQVIQELEGKGWIFKNESGEWEADPLIGICIIACSSNLALKAYKKRVGEEEVYEAYLHLTPRVVVERTVEYIDGVQMIHLSPISDAILIEDLLKQFYPQLSEEMEQQITEFRDIVVPDVVWEKWREMKEEERAPIFQGAVRESLPEGIEQWAIRPESADILAWFERCERVQGLWTYQTCGFAYTDGMLIGIKSRKESTTFFPYSKAYVEQFVKHTITLALGGTANGKDN